MKKLNSEKVFLEILSKLGGESEEDLKIILIALEIYNRNISSKELYSKIAEILNIKDNDVKKAIRNYISLIWNDKNEFFIKEVFRVSSSNKKPSTNCFLVTLIDFVYYCLARNKTFIETYNLEHFFLEEQEDVLKEVALTVAPPPTETSSGFSCDTVDHYMVRNPITGGFSFKGYIKEAVQMLRENKVDMILETIDVICMKFFDSEVAKSFREEYLEKYKDF